MRVRRRSLLAVLAFVATTGALLALTGVTFARVRIEHTNTYYAVFSDAAGLVDGSDVKASGVAVGRVHNIALDPRGVRVRFDVATDVALTEATQARIRYANLTGDRYLELTSGDTAGDRPLARGATIPLANTAPALDLDTLFAGFDPLMQALDPDELNTLTANLIAVTDGQAGSVEALMREVGSFTGSLAKRDKLIGDTIDNLAAAVTTVDDHRHDVDALITGLHDLTRGLAADRTTIGRSLVGLDQLARDTERLLRRTRPDLKSNIDALGAATGALNRQSAAVIDVLRLYPKTLQRLARGGAYGSFFNFFICSMTVTVTLPGVPPVKSQRLESGMERCVNKAGG